MESEENDGAVSLPSHKPWKSIKPIPTFPPPRRPRGEIKSSKPAQLRATHSEGKVTLVYCCTFVIAGFQAILFSLLSRMYAIHEGLYPQTARDHVYGRLINLERGLIAGAGILLIGLATALYAVWDWKQHAFGNLDTERIARLVLPSSVAISLGIEIILFSFLLSTFGLKARPYSAMVEEIERTYASSTKSSED